jgi:hypothetical protein
MAQLEAMDANADSRVSRDEFLEHLGMMTSVLEDADVAAFLEDMYRVRVEVPPPDEPGPAGLVPSDEQPPTLEPRGTGGGSAAAAGGSRPGSSASRAGAGEDGPAAEAEAAPPAEGPSREDVLREAFDKLDRDGSGFIDRSEFKTALARVVGAPAGGDGWGVGWGGCVGGAGGRRQG